MMKDSDTGRIMTVMRLLKFRPFQADTRRRPTFPYFVSRNMVIHNTVHFPCIS